MDAMTALVEAWDEAHWEFTLVFEGLDDADLWRRAHPKLLSVGELAGHVAYSEGKMGSGQRFESPLIDDRFRYYEAHPEEPVVLDLSVQEVLEWLKKSQDAAKEGLAAVEDIDQPMPSNTNMTWRQSLTYRSFHVAYHCGQAYSVRHMMGHKTTDN